MKMVASSPKELKTLQEKEKLLVTSNFSISRSVFKRLVPAIRKNQGLFGKGLIQLGGCPGTTCQAGMTLTFDLCE